MSDLCVLPLGCFNLLVSFIVVLHSETSNCCQICSTSFTGDLSNQQHFMFLYLLQIDVSGQFLDLTGMGIPWRNALKANFQTKITFITYFLHLEQTSN